MPIFILFLGYKAIICNALIYKNEKMIYNCYQGNSNIKTAYKLSRCLITRKLEYEKHLRTEP